MESALASAAGVALGKDIGSLATVIFELALAVFDTVLAAAIEFDTLDALAL
jgi:hypothetical protein